MVSYIKKISDRKEQKSLNPYCSGRWSRTTSNWRANAWARGLNPYCSGRWSRTTLWCDVWLDNVVSLNPYCSGRWSRTKQKLKSLLRKKRLNPYCSGRWSRTAEKFGVSVRTILS